jgi:xylulokinase
MSSHQPGFVPLAYARRPLEASRRDATDFYRTMLTRRTTRHFSTDAVPRDLIETAIRTAGTSPSGAHQQPWTFVAIANAELKARVDAVETKGNRPGQPGAVTPEAAAATGLAVGTPVTCGTIDAAAEAVSVGVRQPGDMMLMFSSSIFVILLADRPLTESSLFHAPWLYPGSHAAMAGLATSGTLTHWFRDHLARDLPRDTAFAALAAEADASPPGAKGLIVLPYFSGERTPIHDPLAKGSIFGMNLTHTRGDLYRATREGIACATRAITDTYKAAGQAPARVRAVGGGTRNLPWLQATSDLTGLDQTLCRVTTGAAYGDAFLAALAVGAVGAGDIDRWNPAESAVRAEHHAAYDRLYPLFQRLYRQTKDIAAELG